MVAKFANVNHNNILSTLIDFIPSHFATSTQFVLISIFCIHFGICNPTFTEIFSAVVAFLALFLSEQVWLQSDNLKEVTEGPLPDV